MHFYGPHYVNKIHDSEWWNDRFPTQVVKIELLYVDLCRITARFIVELPNFRYIIIKIVFPVKAEDMVGPPRRIASLDDF